jgi:hypothetical protein
MSQDRRQAIKLLGAPLVLAGLGGALSVRAGSSASLRRQKTVISVEGDAFHVNGKPTYPGRTYAGRKVEGLLFTSRMANAIIDDHNPETRGVWAYADGPWDPERNTSEFIANLPRYRALGLTSVSVNVQGGSPVGYGWHQPWHTSGYTEDGSLRPSYAARLKRLVEAADAAGMAVVLGLFYYASTPALADEAAIIRATDAVTDLVCDAGYTNVLIEVGNEIDIPMWRYDIIKPARSHELVERIQSRSMGRLKTPAKRLLASTSYVISMPPESFLRVADYVLYHGNAITTQAELKSRLKQIRVQPGYRGQPLLINEDDHFDFGNADNNMLATLDEYCGWGFFDYREIREHFQDGYQSLPVDWGINSDRKKGFFGLLAKVTGAQPGGT